MVSRAGALRPLTMQRGLSGCREASGNLFSCERQAAKPPSANTAGAASRVRRRGFATSWPTISSVQSTASRRRAL